MPARLIPLLLCAALLALGFRQVDASPWFGTWSLRAEDAGGKPETLRYSDGGDGAMRMESIEAGSVIVTRLDGAPVADSGPTSGDGPPRALAVTATSPTSYSWVFWMNGEPFVQGENTLAADGRSFAEVAWRVGKPENKTTLIYERQ